MFLMPKPRLLTISALAALCWVAVHGVAFASSSSSSWLRGTLDSGGQDAPKGLGVDKAYAAFEQGKYLTALKEAKILAAQNKAHAHTLIGLIYEEGLGVPPNLPLAAKHYAEGARLGDTNAKAGYGLMLARGAGVPQDPVTAQTYLEAAAKTGHKTAQYNLGLLYIKGVAGPEDPGQAAYWLLKAAGQGHVRAQYDLGTLYVLGRGVAQSQEKAAQWIGRAAESGDPDAMLDYAIILFKGRGVAVQKAKAVDFFRRAAAKGNMVAQNRLARLYAFGLIEKETIIVAHDYVKAAKWHLIARSRGGERCAYGFVFGVIAQIRTSTSRCSCAQMERRK